MTNCSVFTNCLLITICEFETTLCMLSANDKYLGHEVILYFILFTF